MSGSAVAEARMRSALRTIRTIAMEAGNHNVWLTMRLIETLVDQALGDNQAQRVESVEQE